MADWSKPTTLSNYVTFVDEVKNRDIDAITLQKTALTNPPVGSIKLLRAPVKFQEWSGSAFVDQVLAMDGGGTGSATAAGARTNFGLGTMAVQNANAIAVTGGTISAVAISGGTLLNVVSNGTFTQTGGIQATAIFAGPGPGTFGLHIAANPAAGQSMGLFIQGGTNTADYALNITDRASVRQGLLLRGDMTFSIHWRLVIPVGVNYWAT